jgi:hypothetical protein
MRTHRNRENADNPQIVVDVFKEHGYTSQHLDAFFSEFSQDRKRFSKQQFRRLIELLDQLVHIERKIQMLAEQHAVVSKEIVSIEFAGIPLTSQLPLELPSPPPTNVEVEDTLSWAQAVVRISQYSANKHSEWRAAMEGKSSLKGDIDFPLRKCVLFTLFVRVLTENDPQVSHRAIAAYLKQKLRGYEKLYDPERIRKAVARFEGESECREWEACFCRFAAYAKKHDKATFNDWLFDEWRTIRDRYRRLGMESDADEIDRLWLSQRRAS